MLVFPEGSRQWHQLTERPLIAQLLPFGLLRLNGLAEPLADPVDLALTG
jgi:hypothetical protein